MSTKTNKYQVVDTTKDNSQKEIKELDIPLNEEIIIKQAEKTEYFIMFSVLLGTIVIIAIIGFSKHIYKKQHDFFIRNYYVFPKSLREKMKNTDLFKDLIWFINLVLFVFIIFLLGAIVAFKLLGSSGANHALLKTIYLL